MHYQSEIDDMWDESMGAALTLADEVSNATGKSIEIVYGHGEFSLIENGREKFTAASLDDVSDYVMNNYQEVWNG